jgi:uncharacterized protein (DUF924 family)
MTPLPSPDDLLRFWIEAGPKQWFRKDDAFDAECRDRFLALHERAARGELAAWAGTPEGALGLLLLLDQVPRNAFRGSARSYATDPLARVVAQQAIRRGLHQQVDEPLRNFFSLPFMHSEWLPDQELALQLTRGLGEEAPKFARIHHEIIQRFGRFPHRNAVLGRRTTPGEQAFLDDGGFSG